MKKEFKPETAMARYERLFDEWKIARDKADALKRQWETAAAEVRAELAAK